jgi:ABC-type dipeptide/oligopeptide/nickel transport system permease component
MKTFSYILMVIYFFIVSIPVFIIIFILTHTFYTLKQTTLCIKKRLTQSQSTSKAT